MEFMVWNVQYRVWATGIIGDRIMGKRAQVGIRAGVLLLYTQDHFHGVIIHISDREMDLYRMKGIWMGKNHIGFGRDYCHLDGD